MQIAKKHFFIRICLTDLWSDDILFIEVSAS